MKNEIDRQNDHAVPAPGRARVYPLPSEISAAPGGSSEGAQARPAAVSPPGSLDGSWIEIFRAGDYGDRGAWAPEQLDRLAASYDPRLHAAPVVLGHPADDAPAYGWVRRLRRAGRSLWAQLEKIDPALEDLVRAGRFRQRSVSLYKHFPLTGGPYLRHLGFLGAAPPAVKGLAPVRFIEASAVTLAFDDRPRISLSPVAPAAGSTEDLMSDSKSRLEGFLDHLRSFFSPTPNQASASESRGTDIPVCLDGSHESESRATDIPACPGSGEESAPADSSSASPAPALGFADRLAAIEQRLDALTTRKQQDQTSLEEGRSLPRAEARDARREQIANFVESLRARGRFPPAFDRLGVADFMHRLAAADTTLPNQSGVILSEAKDLPEAASPSSQSLLAWFQDFLTRLPAVIEFGELAAQGRPGLHSPQGAGGSSVVRFTEPRRGMTIDPASVQLAERAEALAAELNISYAEALARLREENRTHTTTA